MVERVSRGNEARLDRNGKDARDMSLELEDEPAVESVDALRGDVWRGDGPHPVDRHVGLRVRMRRKELGVSQERLAESLGITFQQVQKYERGANRVSASKLWEIAAALKTPVAYFYDGLGERSLASADRESTQAFLESTEGMELMAAFPRITEPAIRRKIVELVLVVADED
jgi:transcriptional regulator with XRE-family HTH domain